MPVVGRERKTRIHMIAGKGKMMKKKGMRKGRLGLLTNDLGELLEKSQRRWAREDEKINDTTFTQPIGLVI